MIVDSVRVYITAEDVATTVWKATERKRLHWVIDRLSSRLFYKFRCIIPDSLVRLALRKMAGF